MQITIDTAVPLTDLEKTIIGVITGTTLATATIVEEPAKKPASKPASKPKPEPEPEPEADEDDEDLIGGEPTVEDAVAKATEFVNSGKQAAVKAALKAVGADRVSNIPASKAGAFLEALEG